MKIMFLKCVNKDESLLKLNENDVCFVKFNQLLFKVETPEIEPQGNRLFYKFSSKLDDAEQGVPVNFFDGKPKNF